MFRDILPPNVAVFETNGGLLYPALLPEEAAALEPCAPARLREFALGRMCARAALDALGVPAGPILRGPQGTAIWPDGIAGSITHCDGYCAAAVARAVEFPSLGIDAEMNLPLPVGVLRLVASREEIQMLGSLPNCGLCWDRLLFCAKEAVFKTWFPLKREWLDFSDARIAFDPGSRSFHGTISRTSSQPALRGNFVGRFAISDQHIMAALCLAGL